MTDFISQELANDPELERLFWEEGLILEATMLLCRVMETKGVSRTNLAHKLDKSPAYVTQVLSGSRNISLRTLADFAGALGFEVRMREVDISQKKARTIVESTVQTYPGDTQERTASAWGQHVNRVSRIELEQAA